MHTHKVIPKVALVSKPPKVVVLSYVPNRKLSIILSSSACIFSSKSAKNRVSPTYLKFVITTNYKVI